MEELLYRHINNSLGKNLSQYFPMRVSDIQSLNVSFF